MQMRINIKSIDFAFTGSSEFCRHNTDNRRARRASKGHHEKAILRSAPTPYRSCRSSRSDIGDHRRLPDDARDRSGRCGHRYPHRHGDQPLRQRRLYPAHYRGRHADESGPEGDSANGQHHDRTAHQGSEPRDDRRRPCEYHRRFGPTHRQRPGPLFRPRF